MLFYIPPPLFFYLCVLFPFALSPLGAVIPFSALWWGSRHERLNCCRKQQRRKRLVTLKKARRSLTCPLSAWQRKWPSSTNSHSSPVPTPSAIETHGHGAVMPATRPSLSYPERWRRCGDFSHFHTIGSLIGGTLKMYNKEVQVTYTIQNCWHPSWKWGWLYYV